MFYCPFLCKSVWKKVLITCLFDPRVYKFYLYGLKISHPRHYRVIALISADIVPSLDIEGRELASVRRYPNEGQYSPISV